MERTQPALPNTIGSSQQTSSTPEVAGIALQLRIPPFWRDSPKLWYLNFEAATDDLKKSSAQLTQMVLAQLEKPDIEQISDILFNTKKEDQYKAIKERLISVYEESDSRQLQKLLSEMELGDQKPTQLLRRMRNLARDKISDSTLRMMWTKLLPAQVRSVLAVSETFSTKTSIEELALLADTMLEQTQEVAAVSNGMCLQSAQPSTSNQLDTQFLINEIRKLTLEVNELKRSQHNNYNGNYRRRARSTHRRFSRQRSHSRADSPSTPPFCYYHRRFGIQARRCTTPCNFKKTDQSEN